MPVITQTRQFGIIRLISLDNQQVITTLDKSVTFLTTITIIGNISGDTKINAIAKITRAVLAEMPINDYAVIEQIFDQLGAEKYLQTLFIKEMQNQL